MKSRAILDKIAFPIVVSGASGSGKTTLCHELIAREERIRFSISATTRAPRATEKDGVDYFFVSQEKFANLKTAGELAECALVHGKMYGTPKKWLDDQIAQGISVLLDIGFLITSILRPFKNAQFPSSSRLKP